MENKRYCIGDSFTADCQYATIEKELVEPYPIVNCTEDKITSQRTDDIVFKVYCNHPSLKDKQFVDYVEPYFTCSCDNCPMEVHTNCKKGILRRIIDFFK